MRRVGFQLGGVVAGEGSFAVYDHGGSFADGSPRRRFVFSLQMADRDRALVQALRNYLGAGSITNLGPQRTHWHPTVTLRIASQRGHLTAVIPFMDQFLLESAKRRQYEAWKAELAIY